MNVYHDAEAPRGPLRLFGRGGNSLFQAGNALYALATDDQFRSQAVGGLKYAANHPGQLYDSAISSTVDFYALSGAEQATAFGEIGMNFMVGGGGSKLAGIAGAGALKVGRYSLENAFSGPINTGEDYRSVDFNK